MKNVVVIDATAVWGSHLERRSNVRPLKKQITLQMRARGQVFTASCPRALS